MIRKYAVPVALIVLLILGLTVILTQSTSANQTDNTSPSTISETLNSPLPVPPLANDPLAGGSDALLRDAKAYASEHDIDIATAVERLDVQMQVGSLDAELAENEKDTYAGLWLQHTPDFHIIVQFTQLDKAVVDSYTKPYSFQHLIELREVKYSLAELEAAQLKVMADVKSIDVRVESGINVLDNRVEIYVVDSVEFESTVRESKILIPDCVEPIEVDELSSYDAAIYGGLALSQCTSGFSVVHSNGTRGILTAGHCDNTLNYGGSALPYQSGYVGLSYDVQWHSAPSFTVDNLIYDGTKNRNITGTRHRDNQVVGSYICKYGKTTGYTCGYIYDKSYQLTWQGYLWNPTFIHVTNGSVNLSEAGDSGCPWFIGSIAYGIHSSGLGDDAIYMAINYIDVLDVNVLTDKVYMPLVLKQ